MTFPITVELMVAGIPCFARVNHFRERRGTFSPVALDPEEFYGSTELDYQILDRKGYRADWLERKMEKLDLTSEVEAEIIDLVKDTLEGMKEDREEMRRKEQIYGRL